VSIHGWQQNPEKTTDLPAINHLQT